MHSKIIQNITIDLPSFGTALYNRGLNFENYRYGFNGKEKDDEIYGRDNCLDYGKRVQDTRLGRFFSVDPLTKKYPELSTYQFANNMPIWKIDLDGLEDSNPVEFAPYKSISTAGDVADDVLAFLYNGIVAGPSNVLYNSSAATINASTRVTTTLAWAAAAGPYDGATGKTLPSFAYGYSPEGGFENLENPESPENAKELCKSTFSLLLGEAVVPVPSSKLLKVAVNQAKDAAVDAGLNVILPTQKETKNTKATSNAKPTNAKPTNASSTAAKSNSTSDLPAWAPASMKTGDNKAGGNKAGGNKATDKKAGDNKAGDKKKARETIRVTF